MLVSTLYFRRRKKTRTKRKIDRKVETKEAVKKTVKKMKRNILRRQRKLKINQNQWTLTRK